MNFDGIACNLSTLRYFNDRNVWEAQIYDRIISPQELRIFHNKITYNLLDISSCYTSYFSPDFLASRLSFVGFLLFLVGFWYLVSHKKFRLLAITFLVPVGDILTGSQILGILTVLVELLVSFVGAWYLEEKWHLAKKLARILLHQ